MIAVPEQVLAQMALMLVIVQQELLVCIVDEFMRLMQSDKCLHFIAVCLQRAWAIT